MDNRVAELLARNNIFQYSVYWCKINVQINGDALYKDKKIIKTRPVLVVSKNIANATANIVTVVPLTSKTVKAHIPQHVFVASKKSETDKAIALVEQIMTIKKDLLYTTPIYTLTNKEIIAVQRAIMDLLT